MLRPSILDSRGGYDGGDGGMARRRPVRRHDDVRSRRREPWIHRDPALAERPLHMSMGSYGPKTGMPRILDLLDRYSIKTCVFIPGWIVERYPALCEDILRRGHEVGHHGYLHEKPFFMKSRSEERRVGKECRL